MAVADRLARRTDVRMLAGAFVAVFAFAVVGLGGVVAPPASAQVCDPVYGCPPTTLPGSTPTCSLNAPPQTVGGELVSVFASGAFQLTSSDAVSAAPAALGPRA